MRWPSEPQAKTCVGAASRPADITRTARRIIAGSHLLQRKKADLAASLFRNQGLRQPLEHTAERDREGLRRARIHKRIRGAARSPGGREAALARNRAEIL